MGYGGNVDYDFIFSRIFKTMKLKLIGLIFLILVLSGISCFQLSNKRFNREIGKIITVDKNTIAFVSDRNKDGWNVWLMSLDENKQVPLSYNGVHIHPTWSKDRKWVAFVAGGGTLEDPYHIWKIRVTGKEEKLLTPGSSWDDTPEWSPSGRYIAYSSSKTPEDSAHIWLITPDASAKWQLTKGTNSHYYPTWAQDENQIAFTVEINNSFPQIGIVNINGKGYRIITTGDIPARYPKWSPNSKKIAFVGYTNKGSNIYIINSDGTGLKQLTFDNVSREPSWSLDGKKIIYTKRINDKDDIWCMDADGSNQIQITYESGNNFLPAWIR